MTDEHAAILRAALQDIATADPIPDPLAAFEFCKQVAQEALDRVDGLR